jgi:hypothetical protein
MSKLIMTVTPATSALIWLWAYLLVFGPVALWMAASLIAPSFQIPHWQILLARIGLPIIAIGLAILIVWANRVARKQREPLPADEEWHVR